MLALSFAGATASMAFALRFSALPLVDSIMHLAFEEGVEDDSPDQPFFSAEQALNIQRSAINLQPFTLTKYFETELQCHSSKSKPLARKTPDS